MRTTRSEDGRNGIFAERVADIFTLSGEPIVKAMYQFQPPEVAREFVSVLGDLNRRSADLPHVLSFGDGPISNYFYHHGETVAVDWSGLSVDPLGADGGCFIGSALTWGRQFAEVARHERDLFENYAAGVSGGGSGTSRDVLRAAYLAHISFYLSTIAILPTMVSGPRKVLSREWLEKRYCMPLEEIGSTGAEVIDLLPGYIEEARTLLERLG